MHDVTYSQLRKMFLDFFVSKGHSIVANASLIPENDPTVLFTTAGMHPLVPYLMGEKHPQGTRLVNVQRCIRTGDIEEVGDNSHLTFFEMFGNWSLGDYFKEESLKMSYEFLTQYLNIAHEELAATVFKGDDDAPRDEEAYEIWRSIGLSDEQIFFYDKKENWWGPAGVTGPCGPDSEIFFNRLDMKKCCEDCGPACNCGKYLEIWNNVFMQYNKDAEGNYTPLPQQNIDTGMGLERALCVINKHNDIYTTELFADCIALLEKIANKKYEDNKHTFRKIADHIRSATFILGDDRGIPPSNTEQGYILRRLIRSAIRSLRKLEVTDKAIAAIAETFINKYKEFYPELAKNRKFVVDELNKEEDLFGRTIQNGLKEIAKITEAMQKGETIPGDVAFRLYDTFGFPIEFTKEIAVENTLGVDEAGFKACYAEHQEKSRKGAEKKFKGGLADNSNETSRLHTATHLLQAALRNNIDATIEQKGSNITAERLRFDFSFGRKLTADELAKVEKEVNEVIAKAIPIAMEEMTVEEAKKIGAIGLFGHKYDKEKVKVYSVGGYSKEICGGPHAANSADLGVFKIVKEEASSMGVRRIKATLTK